MKCYNVNAETGLYSLLVLFVVASITVAVNYVDVWFIERMYTHTHTLFMQLPISRVKLFLPPPKKEVVFLVRSVCLSVCPSDYSQTCERILTKFFGGVGHGSRTKWYNFGGDPDHASDPGVQSPKSESSGSVEVCALWVLLVGYVPKRNL